MKFYRGITVKHEDVEMVRADILSHGLYVNGKTSWKFEMGDLRPHISRLFNKTDLSLGDTRPKAEKYVTHPAICACGDELGATYYATTHNKCSEKTVPLIITFTASIDDLWVDGRDFLYNKVFQQGKTQGQREIALQLFGTVLDKYISKAWATDNQDYRIALCDLAISDPEVINSHYNNMLVINGRYNTTFKSAFLVKLPVASDRILSVTSPRHFVFDADVLIEEFVDL